MKICVAHFRTGLTDGVSLQIDERVRILKQFGHDVSLVADTFSPTADLNISYLDYKENLKIKEIQEAAFGAGVLPDLEGKIRNIALEIESQLEMFFHYRHFSLIFIHNIFSLPVCLPATVAFYNFLAKHPDIKAIAVHHDFYWDPPRIKKFLPKHSYVKNILRGCFPPNLPNLSHSVLGKWERSNLKKQRGLEAEVITDTFDFDRAAWQKDDGNKDFLKDAGLSGKEITLLLASRIRPRKGIEIGIDFAHFLSQLTSKKVVLILPNDFREEEIDYVERLKEMAAKLSVDVLWIQSLVGSDEEKRRGIKKYSLWDTYVYADAVLYPSLWEGFGNQFLEAVFAKRPIVCYEYPVYKTDIKPAGFFSINIGKVSAGRSGALVKTDERNIRRAAKNLLSLLDDRATCKRFVESNFRIAKEKFNTRIQLRKYLVTSSERYIASNGIQSIVSPLILSGKLIASGVAIPEAYPKAEMIIGEMPERAITEDELFVLVAKNLDAETRQRYVAIELMKSFFVSPKSRGPLLIFLGGLAGKTVMANHLVQQLSLNRAISLDNEKLHLARKGESKPFLWKSTYESHRGYIKTVEALYPEILKLVERCIFDYGRYRKWCYFFEGIYLSPKLLQGLREIEGLPYHLSVFNLPSLKDVKERYLLRWQSELGVTQLERRRNLIDKYLKNVSAIRAHLAKNMDVVASFVIESPVLEERLSIFYTILYQRLLDIAKEAIPGWIEKVSQEPELIENYKKFLNERL